MNKIWGDFMKIIKYLIAAILVLSITKKVHVENNQKPIDFTVTLTKTDMPKVSGIYDAINKKAFIGFTNVQEYNRAVTPPNISNPKLIRFGSFPTPDYDTNAHGYGGLTKETSLWGIPQTTKPIMKNPELTALNLVTASPSSNNDIERTPEIANIPNLTVPDIKVSGSFVLVKSLDKSHTQIGKYYSKPDKIVILNDGRIYAGITQHKKTHYKGIGPVWTWLSKEEINEIIQNLAKNYGLMITEGNFKADIKKENLKNDIKKIGLIRQNKVDHILYGFLLYEQEIA